MIPGGFMLKGRMTLLGFNMFAEIILNPVSRVRGWPFCVRARVRAASVAAFGVAAALALAVVAFSFVLVLVVLT